VRFWRNDRALIEELLADKGRLIQENAARLSAIETRLGNIEAALKQLAQYVQMSSTQTTTASTRRSMIDMLPKHLRKQIDYALRRHSRLINRTSRRASRNTVYGSVLQRAHELQSTRRTGI
jgi:hypothetical protein